MNDVTHIYKNRVEEREDTFIRYVISALCGASIETTERHTSSEIMTDKWKYYGPYGVTKVGFSYDKKFADCDECILLALALEAEYDYEYRRGEADVRTASDWSRNE